jgi:DNA-directed RNA polymerase subunit RPC12/RpoP
MERYFCARCSKEFDPKVEIKRNIARLFPKEAPIPAIMTKEINKELLESITNKTYICEYCLYPPFLYPHLAK